jgi:quercetin dioxygenase-like cupin family protein
VQQWGGPKQEVRAGDVVWFPPGIKHWHGASAATAMTHIAIASIGLPRRENHRRDANPQLMIRQRPGADFPPVPSSS